MDAWLFCKSLGIGMAVAAPVGPMSLLCIHRTLDRGQVAGSGARAFLTAYGLTMTNPPTILFFAGIFASLALIASAAQSFTFAAGVFAGSMLWWVILTALTAKSAALFRPPVMSWINRISGAVLVAFAVYGFITLA